MKLGLCAAPIQWRKKTKLKSKQVNPSSVKFHNHSERKRKQYLSRIKKIKKINKTFIPFALVGYKIVIANSALLASLAFYHLISNTRS